MGPKKKLYVGKSLGEHRQISQQLICLPTVMLQDIFISSVHKKRITKHRLTWYGRN